MKQLLLPLFLLLYIYGSSQSASQTVIKVGGGYQHSFLHVPTNGFPATGLGYKIGLLTESKYSDQFPSFALQLSLLYQYRNIRNYNNSLYYLTFQKDIQLTTNVTQHVFETTLIGKYKNAKTPFSFGAGAAFSLLLSSTINQKVNNTLDSSNYQFILYNYELKNKTESHQFLRFNIAPVLNIGVALTPKIGLEYYLSYDLLNPSQQYINHKNYNLLNNTLLLTLRIN